MKCYFLLIVALAIVMCAGCTQVSEENKETSTEQKGVSPLPPSDDTSVQIKTTSAAGAPPDDLAVSAQINEKDQIGKSITVIFSGGRGQHLVKRVWVEFNRADGIQELHNMNPKVMDELVLQGSDGEDRVQVFAEYFDGNTYLIGDKSLRLRTRM